MRDRQRMTNHGETAGTSENSDIPGRDGRRVNGGHRVDHGHGVRGGHGGPDGHGDPGGCRGDADGPLYDLHSTTHRVTLRTPGELADALPYLLGYRPEDSMVLVALHEEDGRGRLGGRARLGIPHSAEDWAAAAGQLVQGLVRGSERRGTRPAQMVAYVCQEPAEGESARATMERLRLLAQLLRTECGRLDIPVIEALCISAGRYWSYCCEQECCPSEGAPMGLPGTSVLAAAAAYAGVQVRGSLTELRSRLMPWECAAASDQERVLDAVARDLVPRIVDEGARAEVARETLALVERLVSRFAAVPSVSGTLPADLRDDELLAHDEAAALILGLQDRTTRDRAAEWMEGEEAPPALRLWRALARRCVGSYSEHAAAPLTLAGWVAWSTGDDIEAREAFALAMAADPDYLFARLLHQACNQGLDPESVRRCLRSGRGGRTGAAEAGNGGALRGADAGEESGEGAGTEGVGTESAGAVPGPVGAEADGPGGGGGPMAGPGSAGRTGAGPQAPATARSCADPEAGLLNRRRRPAHRRAGSAALHPRTARTARTVGRRTRRTPFGGHTHPGPTGPGAPRPRTAGRGTAGRGGAGFEGPGRRAAADPDGSGPACGNDAAEGEV
jgi:Domain of unknown function (DUF4192)